MSRPEDYEIHNQIIEGLIGVYGPSICPELTYEEGVVAALTWVIGQGEPPMSRHISRVAEG